MASDSWLVYQHQSARLTEQAESLKISSIKLYNVPWTYQQLGHGRATLPEVVVDDSIVCIETDTGVQGWGEGCPTCEKYINLTAGGVRSGFDYLGPTLLGQDPRELGVINQTMDQTVLGHEIAKSALDIACLDAFGKSVDLPVKTLLGGAQAESSLLYNSIPMDDPDTMIATIQQKRAQGIRVFQVKLGQGAEPDIRRIKAIAPELQQDEKVVFDANCGWSMEDARRVAMVVDQYAADTPLLLEQPCATYEECLSIRRMCRSPFVLDEAIWTMSDLTRAMSDKALDALAIKLSEAGGLTRARELATVAQRSGLRMRIEDQLGAEIVFAAVAHLAATIPAESLIAAYPHVASVSLGKTDTMIENGKLITGNKPGIGFEPDLEILGDPIAVYR